MNTRQELAGLLEDNEGTYISGSLIAEKLGITRAAVWKNIRLLQADGYDIEAVKNKGYRLGESNDVLSENKIRKYLGEHSGDFSMEVHDRVSSTNTVIREHEKELPDWYTVIADSQEKGRGRRGRNFFSPPGTGIYLSILIRLPLTAEAAAHITTAAAVAACRAVEECTDAETSIKWVNDVFVDGKKICGILTEASISMESGGLDWAVMGIGINAYEPEGGFPEEIAATAGFVARKKTKDFRARLAAAFMISFRRVCDDLIDNTLIEEYRRRSFIIGMPVNVLRGDESIPAVAEDVDDECRLLVRYEDGRTEALSSGEVSVRPK